ncbi:hypothetical protein WA026_001086 [Henosepilachna vigintioctopunctata]|uniref:Serine/threonine-protein kinase RIO1 n=1 Tax=Henosepilachna vigintioctopunctata TaxID=420089 RepID=A0AAW1UZR5_9CUCU
MWILNCSAEELGLCESIYIKVIKQSDHKTKMSINKNSDIDFDNLSQLNIDDFTDDYVEDYNSHEEDYFSDDKETADSRKTYQPTEKLFPKFANKINIGKYDYTSLPGHAVNLLRENDRKLENVKYRTKDKHDRATVEQVLDPRTRMIVFKILSQNIISQIHGSISRGKEANVFYASAVNKEYAIKIYKTSILEFKDRDKYVTGEFRFRRGYSKHNPRKMVQIWAEKEMRNLTRLKASGLRAPEPVLLKSHVLLMSFIGKNGWPAPKLKDVDLTQSKARELYRDIVIMIWRMYNKCKLVHADLSEFNLLYFEGEVYIIDVSQSVEHDHPKAFTFLRKDCTNITDFFKKKDVATMSLKDLFNFITDPTITEENMEECLGILSEKAGSCDITADDVVEEEIFKEQYIPQTLTDVIDFERDINKVKSGQGDDLVYKTLVGLKSDLSGPAQHPEILQKNSDEDSNCDDDTDEEKEKHFVDSSRPKHESLEEKKARKQAVKEEKAKKRETKIKKHVKKRNERIKKK